MAQNDQDSSQRYKTFSLDRIDADTVAQDIVRKWRLQDNARGEYLDRRNAWMQTWRDLSGAQRQGPWENSANYHVPVSLIYGKGIHARLWQLFSDFDSLIGVKARQESFEAQETQVAQFMSWVLSSFSNSGNGTKDTFDEWLWDNVMEGSGYLKLYWGVERHKFVDFAPVTESSTELVFDRENLTGVTRTTQKTKEQKVTREEFVSTPHIKRILIEDIIMPIGQNDPQTADTVMHRCYLRDDQLKMGAINGTYDKDAVDRSLVHKQSYYAARDKGESIKLDRERIDGNIVQHAYYDEHHVVLEYYGKLYVKPELDGTESDDISAYPEEVVVWLHWGSKEILGWTYLHTVSPAGIRPIFKSDFIRFPDRTNGVGVGEVLYDINTSIDAIYNMRVDNGTLASLPMGFYRASSSLKPDTIKIYPGNLYPVDDPQNDVKIVQFPFLQNFGYQEEDRLTGYAEKLLSTSDLQLGRPPNRIGALRNATGSNLLATESNVQLEIHYDRIARALTKLFKALFILCRTRMPDTLYYRVTGDRGEPVFGKVNRDDLKGDFDFVINVDVLGQSRLEQQQQATLMMQTLINPAFMNTGTVTPTNLFNLAKNFLQSNRMKRVEQYVTEPKGYEEFVTPNERVFRIVSGRMDGLLDTVRLDEDHDKAIAVYEAFKASDLYGLLKTHEQIQALEDLIAKHKQLQAAQQAGGNPNLSGMQVPREGFQAVQPNIGGGGETLQAPHGEANGPVV